uniref:Protein OSCP1 n=1 Tax=Romanomermis culicivorax TaxID=13658 RepID=A0A915J8V3_ROMCU
MSLKTLPLIFLNLGGEMCYILDQRLQAQSVKKDRANRVMSDIISTMFNVKFMDDLFQPQDQYGKKAMRSLFDKLAHVSIMRLNSTSMDKLYDLMIMAVKYQLQCCTSPKDMLVVLMNHLDGIRKYVQCSPNIQAQIDYAYNLIKQTYFSCNSYELNLIRRHLFNFFQESRIKISVLMKEKQQKEDGYFVLSSARTTVPYGGFQPGQIRYYSAGKVSKTIKFPTGLPQDQTYAQIKSDLNLEKTAKQSQRGSDLGVNMYKYQESTGVQGGYGSSAAYNADKTTENELKLLSFLLTKSSYSERDEKTDGDDDFKLNLFDNDQQEADFLGSAVISAQDDPTVIRIDASKQRESMSAAEKLVSGLKLTVEETKAVKSIGDEMLELMDS